MNQIIDVLKNLNYQIPKELLLNYKNLKISSEELIIIIYLINQYDMVYNPKKISKDLNISINEVLEIISSLSDKKILSIDIKKINNIRTEIINLDYLYEKTAFLLKDVDIPKESNNIYSLFETEFGRTLSPMEFEIINGWIDSDYSEELIKLALKEATYNGVNNLRYIDRIIYEWGKKGIKTREDVEKNRKQFKSNTKNQKLFDYDWLNDEE